MENEKPVRVGILGAGSIGAFVGACLSHISSYNLEVTLVGRESLIQSVEGAGNTLTLKSIVSSQQKQIDRFGSVVEVKAPKLIITTDHSALADMDVIVISLKATQTVSAGESLREVLEQGNNKHCVIVSFQNGVGNAEVLSKYLPNHVVLASMVEFNAVWHRSSATFSRNTDGFITLENKDEVNQNQNFKVFHRSLSNAGFHINLVTTKEIQEVLYGKLLINLFNPVNAVSGIPVPETLSFSKWRRIWAALIEEALKVYAVAGIKPKKIKANPKIVPTLLRLPTWLYSCIQFFVTKMAKDSKSSMLQDLENRRVTEIDYINGQVVKLAKEHGTTAPLNEKMVALIHTIEKQQENNGEAGFPLPPDEVKKFLGLS
mmetsp:Transcript_14122/g.16076  ORF Transcript_14122/g.16076 Transcript_14122/m.16076 type:complete len:374 (+) Transcript_14122:76-1197(+)|eukprot:CAMPEP_0184021804 /NCGR_PEP_ID=MMETSP0954-20121128/10162_1 /TAXON_ID=627963 /ORGANISM="Aplanochytrium sp, Strain PBS07" /LENGTH=373 /DNA_ID=CAMNT_0026303925 /DNA_START=26 /DNA_END=1147 /DNA_ORIENTATION=-